MTAPMAGVPAPRSADFPDGEGTKDTARRRISASGCRRSKAPAGGKPPTRLAVPAPRWSPLDRVTSMTTAAKLLARKQELLKRLQEDPGPHEREEIERLLEKIDAALNLLENGTSGATEDD
jgi:hypothetical protein